MNFKGRMSSVIFHAPWLGRRTWVVFLLLLFTFEYHACIVVEEADPNLVSVDNIGGTLRNSRHKYKTNIQKCETRRNVCTITELFNKIGRRMMAEKKDGPGTFNESKTKKNINFGSTEKARENSEMKYNSEQEVSSTLNYSDKLEEFDRLRKKDLESKSKFPSEEVCPYLSVRAESTAADNATTCRTSQLNESECEFINTYLGKPREIPTRSCRQRKTAKTLCFFGKRSRSSIQDMADLRCVTGICRDDAVYLGVFNTTLGQVMPDDDWRRLANANALVEAIGDVMKKDYSNHFRFCFLRCFLKDNQSSTTKQILIFPPIVHHCPKTSTPRININIIVQDSISRPQFYRSLPKTVNSLREINHDSTMDTTVLEFEKYQSYDSSTHSNIKKLFAGKKPYRNFTDVSSTIKKLYKKFTKASYRTLFQEDACWFEGFGSLLRPSFLKDTSRNDTCGLWKGLNEYMKENLLPYIDTFGVGFSSCKVLQDLGDTNIFNGETLPALCFDGRPLSYYYLNVVKNFFDAYKDNSCPVFSYLHLNTGHEHTGQRITQDDEYLARFLNTMAKHHSTTLTVLLSDHGSKTSEYATRTVHGLKEIYKPFMFVILPRKAAEILGNERMRNLIRNQKRLVALEDLNLALDEAARGFVEHKMENNAEHFESATEVGGNRNGLFSEISSNRNCSELKLSADAVCQCEGEDVETVMDSFFLDFLASFAVGDLNNMIQSQYTSTILNTNTVHSKYIDRDSEGINNRKSQYLEDIKDTLGEAQGLGGYGNCLRYILNRVERLRSKVVGEDRITTFSVVLNTVPAIRDRVEIFEMTFGHHLTKTSQIRLLKVARLSRYSVFKSCADESVQLELCTCDPNSRTDPQNYIWDLLGYYMFAQPTNIEKLGSSCLYLITTKRQRFLKNGKGRDAFLAYEIINACDRIFNVTLLDNSLVREPFLLSRPLPFSIMVYPNAAHHVISALCGLPEGEFVASFKVDVVESL